MTSVRARIFSASALHDAWHLFRADFKRAPSPGVDGVDFRSFDLAAKSQTAELAAEIAAGTYYHRPLRASFIRKEGSSRKRCINVPTIRDRLVQRVVLRYIRDRFDEQLRKMSGYGVLQQASVEDALLAVEKYLPKAHSVLRLDIQSFFDSINRSSAEQRVRRFLRAASLEKFAVEPINVETQLDGPDQKAAFSQAGMRHGVGLRQGQPLSPLYALLFLHPLDTHLTKKNIPFVRYVDDVLVFCQSKVEAEALLAEIAGVLSKIGLKISPSQTKTFIRHASDRFEFLGVALQREANGVARYLPKGIIADVEAAIAARCTSVLVDEKPGALIRFAAYLQAIDASYRSSYGRCRDWPSLQNIVTEQSRRAARTCVSALHSSLRGRAEEKARAYRALGIK